MSEHSFVCLCGATIRLEVAENLTITPREPQCACGRRWLLRARPPNSGASGPGSKINGEINFDLWGSNSRVPPLSPPT